MIEINNLTTISIDEDFLIKIVKKVLEREKKKNKDLSIALVDQRKIKALNKKYRKKNRITDVLSFQYNNSGEIVICLQEIKKNASKFDSTFKKELTQVLVHGILHLLGYDHEKSETEAEKMKEREEYYLLQLKD